MKLSVVTLGSHPYVDRDLDYLHTVYESLGVQVMRIISKTTDAVFHRDVFAWTPYGLIKCRMGKPSRRWEVDAWFEWFRSVYCEPPALVVPEPYTFEGADLLWIDERTALIANGPRTCVGARDYIANWLISKGATVHTHTLPDYHDQHLLGVTNTINGEIYCLNEEHDDHILLPQEEYAQKGPNWVTVDQSVVVINRSCEATASLLRHRGIVTVPVPIDQLLRYEGGIACSTGTLQYV